MNTTPETLRASRASLDLSQEITILIDVRNLLASLASAADLLENSPNVGHWERKHLHDCIEMDYTSLDRYGVPFRIQNAATRIGHKNELRGYISSDCNSLAVEFLDLVKSERGPGR